MLWCIKRSQEKHTFLGIISFNEPKLHIIENIKSPAKETIWDATGWTGMEKLFNMLSELYILPK